MIIQNGYIVAVSTSDANYETIVSKIKDKPSDPVGYQYKLKADSLEYELVKIIPDEELDDSEALSIITGETV